MRAVSEPRLPILIASPKTRREVGSPSRQSRKRILRARKVATICATPSLASPSSSEVRITASEAALFFIVAARRRQATIIAATEVFISAAPRPNKNPSRSMGTKGSLVQAASPGGTTSMWPAKAKSTTPSPRRVPARFAQNRPQIVDAVFRHSRANKARVGETLLRQIERARLIGRDRAASDEPLCEVERFFHFG